MENKHSINNINKNLKVLKYCEMGSNKLLWEELFLHKNKKNTQNVLINRQTRPTFESEIVYKNKNQLNLKGYVMILIEPKMTE